MKRRDFLKVAFSSSLYFAARRVFPANLGASVDVGIGIGADPEQTTIRR